MKILITGGAGFIGFYLAKYYTKKHHDVTIIDNLYRGNMDKDLKMLLDNKNIEFINHNLTETIYDIGYNYDIVFHLAAVNGTRNFYEHPYDTSKINLLSLFNIIDYCKKNNKNCKFIFTSSSEVYACEHDKKIPTDENVRLVIDDIFNPRFSYATSKIAGESIVLNCGLNSIIIRPHNIYGPRMGTGHVIPENILKLKNIKQKKYEYLKIQSDGSETRSFCYIDDMIKAIDIITRHGKIKEIYNIGSDKEILILDLIKKIMKLMNVKTRIITSKPMRGSTNRRCADITRIKKLGYRPIVDLDDGLIRTIRWYEKI